MRVHGFMLVCLSHLYIHVFTALCTWMYHDFYVCVSMTLCTWVYHDLIYACPRLYARMFITTLCICFNGFMRVGLSRLYVKVSMALCTLVYHDFICMCPWLYAMVLSRLLYACVHGFMHVGLSQLLASCTHCSAWWHGLEIHHGCKIIDFSLLPIMRWPWFLK